MNDNIKTTINYDYDLIIIGAGPAGLTAAIYAQRGNLQTLLIEKELPGGKMIKTGEIENYPGYQSIQGMELSAIMEQQVQALGVTIMTGEVIAITDGNNHLSKTIVLKNNKTLVAKAVIIATGCVERKLGVPGEIEYTNRGVSYCAVCDGFLYKDKIITVVGGGYSACEEALFLTRLSNKVNLIHRRKEFRADQNIVAKVKNNKAITLHLDWVVSAVIGDEKQNKVIKIKLKNLVTQAEKIIATDVLFPYIGAIPITDFVNNLKICNQEGYIEVDQYCQTALPGLFAAGDVVAKSLRQVVTATNDGAIAAQYAIIFIDNLQ